MQQPHRRPQRRLLVLVSLADGPKRGYAIQEDIGMLTGDLPGPDTLYGAIKRLKERGLIEALAAQDRRKPCQLTPAGRRMLRAELERTRSVAAVGLRRLAVT
ncbi:PadR family transcriptional regulator [Dactylosporangium sp. NPDC049742]|uniref:PadR family transcriptional regulator n=1 Tax=Dactylosporangium sp. NPDC049742 TaxID=3154737 RepID=UPI003415A384